MLKGQVQLASGPNNVIFQPEDDGGMDGSSEGHAMRRLYCCGVYSAAREEVR